MPLERFCADCGLPLPGREDEAGCPHCLLRLAMGEDPDLVTEAAVPGQLRSRFFGDYELLGEVARGGMGVVFRARQLTLNRIVALKMIQAGHLPSPEAWMRFQREIAASAHLTHPHIVPLYESGEVSGTQFFTMRLLEGGTLATRLGASPPGSRLAQLSVAHLLIKVAKAVHYAHQRGVLHRDLKPSNILLDEEGEPHVADFGLAKILADSAPPTLTESILGSPNYMAPEVADGRGRDVTVETDVYGLGAILYEALTAVPPFQARSPVETMRKVIDDNPVPPRRLNPGIDADLETICLKCLQKNPATRYGSALELAADMERWSRREPIVARPLGPFGVAIRWCRRYPALAALSCLLLATLVLVATGASIAAVRIRSAEQAAVQQLRESLLDQVRVLRLSQAAGGPPEAMQRLRQAVALGGDDAFRDRLRDEALATLALPHIRFEALPGLPKEGIGRCLVHPSQAHLAKITVDNRLSLAPIKGLEPGRNLGQGKNGARLIAFSPDGHCLAVRHAEGIDFLETNSGRVICSAASRSQAFCFGAQGSFLALEESPGEISIRELPSGQQIQRIPHGARAPGVDPSLSAISLAPDGKTLVRCRSSERIIDLIDLDQGKVLWSATQSAPVLAFAWHPTRSWLLASLADGRILALRPSDGSFTAGLTSPSAATGLTLHEDRDLLAGSCRDRRTRIWDLASMRQLVAMDCEGLGLQFDQEATRLTTVAAGERLGWLALDSLPVCKEAIVAGNTRDILQIGYTCGGDALVIAHPGRFALMNASGRGFRGAVLTGDSPPVFAADPLGKSLVIVEPQGITVRDLSAGSVPASGERFPPRPRTSALAIRPDGSQIWTAEPETGVIEGWTRDLATSEAKLSPHPGVDLLVFSPSGRWLASGSSRFLDAKIWDTRSGELVFSKEAGRDISVHFSGDERWVAICGDTFALHRVGTWEPAPSLPYGHNRPTLGAAAFSGDGRLLAIVENQEQVRLLDLHAGRFSGLLPPPATGHAIHSLAFSPDNQQLACACARGRIRLWDLAAMTRAIGELGLAW